MKIPLSEWHISICWNDGSFEIVPKILYDNIVYCGIGIGIVFIGFMREASNEEYITIEYVD